MAYTIAALYRFTPIADAPGLRLALKQVFACLDLCGSLLVAPEGINGTLAGSAESIDRMLEILGQHTGLSREDVKFSHADEKPFNRLRVRLKREIITFKQPAADPTLSGAYIAPRDWNALMADPDVVVLDVRNRYETEVGVFEGATDPGIDRFTDFAAYVRENLAASRHKKIAMYCTGGIRCEKASAFMRAGGFAEVYHLKGGILKYLEEIPAGDSKWRGECYVFDKRVAVTQGVERGSYSMCLTCGAALPPGDHGHVHESLEGSETNG